MKKWKLISVLLGAEILQTTILGRIHILGASPNLALALTVAIAILYGARDGSFSGIFLGLLEDIMFSGILGIRALIYYVSGFVTGSVMANSGRYYWTGAFSTVLLTLLTTLVNWFIHIVLQVPITNFWYIKGPVFIEAIMNGLLFILSILVIRRFFKPDTVRKCSGY